MHIVAYFITYDVTYDHSVGSLEPELKVDLADTKLCQNPGLALSLAWVIRLLMLDLTHGLAQECEVLYGKH